MRFPPFLKRLVVAVLLVPVALTLIALYLGNLARDEGGPSDNLPQQYWVLGANAEVESSNTPEPCPLSADDLNAVGHLGAVVRRGGLFVHDRFEIMPMPNGERKWVVQRQRWTAPAVFLIQFLPLISLIVVVAAFGLLLGGYFLAREGRTAAQIFSELKKRNFHARFPERTEKWFGSLIVNFNAMAAEIETLVAKLKDSEERRSGTLKELAHDVRTPLAGMRLVVEDILESRKLPPAPTVRRKVGLVLSELDYLQELVSGLLTLAQLEDPALETATGPVELGELLKKESAIQKESIEFKGLTWKHSGFAKDKYWISAEVSVLGRAFRNVLDNAARHAEEFVSVEISQNSQGRVCVTIRNDGATFSPEALSQYGRRRNVRLINVEKRRKGSVGLGSVIVKAAVLKFGGTLKLSNWSDGRGRQGAEVSLEFPALAEVSNVA